MAEGEGTWDTTKEILGWILDGSNFTLTLPENKCNKIVSDIKLMVNKRGVPLKDFQKVAGKLQHASFGVPGGRGLMSPIHRALGKSPRWIRMTGVLKQTLRDWASLVRDLARNPTLVTLLIRGTPDIIQYSDACGLGAGGVVCSGTRNIQPLVWQFEWPADIKARLITDDNPDGDITINDLELAGIVLGWLVIEKSQNSLAQTHIGSFCDNTSAVSWAYKGHTAKSIPAARLLRFLCLRQRTRQVSSLTPLHISGINNLMADISSRAFKTGKFFDAHNDLLSYFTTHFPLPQNQSWKVWTLPEKLSSRVISCLCGEQAPLESLVRLPGLKTSTGNIGPATQQPLDSHPSSTTQTNLPRPSSQWASLQGSGQELTASELKSKFSQSPKHLHLCPRPSNWLENPVRSTKIRKNTLYPSDVALKASADKILPPSHS